jgi:thioredoxin-related protein
MKAHLKLFTVLAPFLVFSAWAGDQFMILAVGDTTYTNVTITSVTATDIYFTYDKGMGNAKIKDLSLDLRERYHYDEAQATAIEKKQTQNNVQYHSYVVSQPAAQQPDESRLPDSSSATQSSVRWGTDFSNALSQAQSQNKLVLMDFTASDWSPACTKFDQEVLSTPQFAAYAQSKLVLLQVDFPHGIPQTEKVRYANRDLANRFNVSTYPTLVLVDSSGTELGRQTDYAPGGPSAFIAELDSFSKK